MSDIDKYSIQPDDPPDIIPFKEHYQKMAKFAEKEKKSAERTRIKFQEQMMKKKREEAEKQAEEKKRKQLKEINDNFEVERTELVSNALFDRERQRANFLKKLEEKRKIKKAKKEAEEAKAKAEEQEAKKRKAEEEQAEQVAKEKAEAEAVQAKQVAKVPEKEEKLLEKAMNYFDNVVKQENIADDFISIEKVTKLQEMKNELLPADKGGKKQAKKPKRRANKTKRAKKSNKKKRKPKRKTLRKIKKIIFR